MEISRNNLQPFSPVQQSSARPEAKSAFEQKGAQDQENKETAEYLPRPAAGQEPSASQLDYRQLLRQARYQQAGTQQNSQKEAEAYRIETEPHRVQQALGSYRDNAQLEEGKGELMPRLDDYV